ncbi:MAG: winged helix-turn-helix domain-containing protein [Steroidobacteraceae bacterium]
MVQGYSVSYRCGEFSVDPANRRFARGSTEIDLEPKVFAVILQLLAQPGTLLGRNELLDAIWGHRYVTPSTLNRLIALARRAFGDDPDVPRFIQTVYGSGYRYIGPFEKEEAGVTAAPVRFAPPPSARLPARFDSLIGRSRELETLAELFVTHRAITVLGAGGIGKTQCALEYARLAAGDYPDGVWFFDLAPLVSAEQSLRGLAAALAIASDGIEDLQRKVTALLQGRRTLLVLDNCDRIATGVGIWVFELLRGTEGIKVLATSQAPLGFVAEQLMQMPPLELPAVEPNFGHSLEDVTAAAAMQMLISRVRLAQPLFKLTPANARTLVEICIRLDGMPLALELAATRFALLSPDQVLERLEHRFRFLNSDAAGRDSRHRNLLALLDWSFSLLAAEEQRLLTWFSIFVQGWTVEAAMDLAAPLGSDPEFVVDLLTGLVRKSLVSAIPGLTPPRYRLLESVREYALGHLQRAGEEQRARAAHLAHVVGQCRKAHLEMAAGRGRGIIEALTREDGNIQAAVAYALLIEGNRSFALQIIGDLTLYAKARGTYSAVLQWCRRALAGTEGQESPERGRTLLCMGVAAFHFHASEELSTGPPQHPPDRALDEAARIARLHQDAWTEGYASGYHAMWLSNIDRAQEAGARLAVTERIARQLDDPLLLGLAGLARGWTCLATGNDAAAIEALTAVRDLGSDLHQQHFINMYVALAHFSQGNDRPAAAAWLDAMRRIANVTNMRGIAGSIEGCGYLCAKFGRFEEGARLLGVARNIRERTLVPLFNFWRRHNLAAQAVLRTNLRPAEYEKCVSAGRQMRDEDAASQARALLQEFVDVSGGDCING